MDTETKIRSTDPYYSTDGYLDVAIKSLAVARKNIHIAKDAMDGAEGMTSDVRAEAMTKQLEGLEAFVSGLEEGMAATINDILDELMARCIKKAKEDEGDE